MFLQESGTLGAWRDGNLQDRIMRTIRAKLTLAFLLIIVVCLVPTSAAAAYVIRYYQRQDALERLSSYGQTVAGAALSPRIGQLTPSELVTLFNEQRVTSDAKSSNALIVVTDARGVELADSENRFVGKQWTVPEVRADARTLPVRSEFTGKLQSPDGSSLAVAVFRIDRRIRGNGVQGQQAQSGTPSVVDPNQTASILIVALPWSAMSDAWAVIGGRLQGIVIVALVLAVMIAFILSRSLTSRLRTLTQGANAMASGDYDRAMQLANVRTSSDEVGELANAFQIMATNVSRAQRSQRELIGNVSHELKTPLTSIQGFSQAMLDGTVADDAEYQELAQIIQQEALRMRRLVEQMLELSRLEAGTVPLDLSSLRVDELIENVGKRYIRMGEAKGVTVRWATPRNTVIRADGGRIEQVLVNLLDNALEYTDTGGHVTLFAQVARLNRVEFVIQDTGRGIPADDVPRLFERFYQVERSRTGQGRHVGLGLAIVREIVDAHHGEITVQSTLGVGTTITVSIPDSVTEAHRVEHPRTMNGYATDASATVPG